MEQQKLLSQSHWNHIIATFIYVLIVLFIKDGETYLLNDKVLIIYIGLLLNICVFIYNNLK